MTPAPFEHHYTDIGDVQIHHVSLAPPAGEVEMKPVVLLHGWPQSWFEWRDIMPALAEERLVIAPDLRGLGDSSRPPDGYDKRTVAEDIWLLLTQHLGISSFHLVGHDWGGPTAFALAAMHPDAVASLSILDVVVPGDGGDFSQGGRRWHHAFHMTPDLPEALITGREDVYLSWFYREFSWRRDAISAEALSEYLRTYTQPGALRAGFSYYRAIPEDAAANRDLLATGFRLPMPVLAMGGAKTESRGRAREPEQSMRRVADNVRGVVVENSGHFIPEECPDVVIEELRAHFSSADCAGDR